jgi:5'-3' exonuclease
MTTWIVLDSSYISYFHSYNSRGLSSGGARVDVVFGFFKTLLALVKKFETSNFVFAFDSNKSIRQMIYPEYKKKRRDLTDEEKRLCLVGKIMVTMKTNG